LANDQRRASARRGGPNWHGPGPRARRRSRTGSRWLANDQRRASGPARVAHLARARPAGQAPPGLPAGDRAAERRVGEPGVVAGVDRVVDRERALVVVALLRQRDRHGHLGARVVEAEDEGAAHDALRRILPALLHVAAVLEALGDDGRVSAVA